MKKLVTIEWDEPADINWLNKYNIAVVLHEYCKNTKFKVEDVTADDIVNIVKNEAFYFEPFNEQLVSVNLRELKKTISALLLEDGKK